MSILHYILPLLTALISFLLLRRHMSRRQQLALGLCLMAAALGFGYHSNRSAPSAPPAITEEERVELTQQQQIFSAWYTDYSHLLDQLDYNWQQYGRILSDFREDNISIQTAFLRLNQLERESEAVKLRLIRNAPPLSLNDANYDLSAAVSKKTLDYAQAQYEAIHGTADAADQARSLALPQEEISRQLEDIRTRKAPPALFTAGEIAALRDNLSIEGEAE